MPANGDDGEHDPVFSQCAAIANQGFSDDLVNNAGIDAHAAYGDLACLPRATDIDFQAVPGFEHKRFFQPEYRRWLASRACLAIWRNSRGSA